MNKLVTRLRLYRIITICKIPAQYFKKSQKIAHEYNLSALIIFWDMVRSLIKFGASDENYEQFHFWEHDDAYKNSFITWRRNMAIMYKFCSQEAKDLFLNKVTWNNRFAKYVKRDWIYCKEASIETIKRFLQTHKDVIVKRIDGACGVGIDKYTSSDILRNTDLLTRLGGANIILEELAVNTDSIRKFSPTSLNTFRFVTCIDRMNIPLFISSAFSFVIE